MIGSHFKIFIYLLYVSTLSLSSDTHQKRALDPITDGCEPPFGCWELNSGPLEEQSVLLIAEPSLQPKATPPNSATPWAKHIQAITPMPSSDHHTHQVYTWYKQYMQVKHLCT